MLSHAAATAGRSSSHQPQHTCVLSLLYDKTLPGVQAFTLRELQKESQQRRYILYIIQQRETRPNRPQVWPEDDMSRMVRGTESRRTPPPSFRVLRPVEPSWVLDAIAVAVATWSDEGGTWGGLAVAVGSSRS